VNEMSKIKMEEGEGKKLERENGRQTDRQASRQTNPTEMEERASKKIGWMSNAGPTTTDSREAPH